MTEWTEAQVIDEISRTFPVREDLVERGIGDDCAVMQNDMKLITTDASIEGVHFDLRWMSVADAAYRCMTSNVSDIAAMGAYAGPFTLALGLPPSLDFYEIRKAIQAIKSCIIDHELEDCWLIGGDVVRSPFVMFSVTVLGKRPEWPVVCRNTAKPGDTVIAMGNLGHAAAGLALFDSGTYLDENRIKSCSLEPLLKAFCRPKALTGVGPILAKNRLVSSMMDLSDGIRTDLPRLLKQSQCGAVIDLDALVPDKCLLRACDVLQCDARDWMACGGEDFGLLMTATVDNVSKIEKIASENDIPCIILGKCTQNSDLIWNENGRLSSRKDQSFAHF